MNGATDGVARLLRVLTLLGVGVIIVKLFVAQPCPQQIDVGARDCKWVENPLKPGQKILECTVNGVRIRSDTSGVGEG